MIHSVDDIPEDAIEKALMLKNMVVAVAQNGSLDEATYRSIRSDFVSDPSTKPLLPTFIRTCRDNDSLWAHLKMIHSGSGAWEARGKHIEKEFSQLLEYLEESGAVPSDTIVTDMLSRYDAEGVRASWSKALNRRSNDPQGAITAARTLLEEVCKHILEDSGEQNLTRLDLPKLYSKTSKLLNLAPSQHTLSVFKQILGGCQTVVEGLGGLRNKIGDAHGSGRQPVKPAPRHAALAVNLAGSMAMFLVETWLAQENGDD